MKKKFIVILLTLLMINMSAIRTEAAAKAASGKVSVYYSNSKPVIGTRVTIKITASCSQGIGGGLMRINFDTSYFRLVSHNAGDNYNSSNRKLMLEPTKSSSEVYTFVFEAKKTGNTSITVLTEEFIPYNDGYDYVSGYSDEIRVNFAIQTKTSNNQSTVTLSADNSLSSLKVENYTLEEKFSSDRLEYTLYVPNGVSKLNIEAKASSGKASVKEINSSLQEGWNKIEIVCVAENKAEKKYVLNVYVEESPKVFFDFEGKKLGAVVSLRNIELEGFSKNPLEEVTEFATDAYHLLYLTDEEGNTGFYHYDRENNAITGLYQSIKVNGSNYVLTKVNYEDFPKMDEETFRKAVIEINGVRMDGWKYNAVNMFEMAIVYLRDQQGEGHLYQYDAREKTMQRFILPLKEVKPVEKKPLFEKKDYIIMGVSGFVFLLSVLMIIRSNNKVRYYKNKYSSN